VNLQRNRPFLTATQAPAVICLHSSASSARQWAPLQDALADEYRPIAPDLLGYGAAREWPFDRTFSLDDEARAVESLIDAEPGGVHLVGHSFGGAVALHVALRNPGRVKSVALYEPVLANLLQDNAGARAAYVEFASVRIAVRRAVYSGRADYAANVFVDYWSGPGAWRALPEKRRQAIAQRMRKVDAEFDAIFRNMTTLSAYRGVGVPVLLMLGGATRRPARAIADLLGTSLPDVRRQEISDAGHLGPLTHAGEVNTRIRAFLAAQYARVPLAQAA